MTTLRTFITCMLLSLGMLSAAWADRVKDLTSVAGARSNQLIGYGVVVGLQGTGDGADVTFTGQSLKSILNRLGVSMEGDLSDFVSGIAGGKLDFKDRKSTRLNFSHVSESRMPSSA